MGTSQSTVFELAACAAFTYLRGASGKISREPS